jgi:predicted CXXCH cytochrome family protein
MLWIRSWLNRVRARPLTWALTTMGIAAGVLLATLLFDTAMVRRALHRTQQSPRRAPAGDLHLTSDQCQRCHADVFAAWKASQHAQAHRSVDARLDADAFGHPQHVSAEGVDYDIDWENGKPRMIEKQPGHPPFTYTADYVLGFDPLRQYIVPVGGGRFQAAELAYDPAKKDWFNVFGGERRQPAEWGSWHGRGMNWNSMCAHCHNTDFRKNYDPVTDTYASTWTEQGVGCVQCHGGLTLDHLSRNYHGTKTTEPPTPEARRRIMESCAPCHVRNELLTGTIVPGGRYADHYRMVLPTQADTFYPDGQVRGEDFNYTSLLTSRMGGKAGVTCLDCHDPHTGKPRLPVENNALCLQCHGGANRLNAPVIDPTAHSHHPAGSAGDQCVACHMPTTTYMQRDPRHDHGFLRPDPLLTKELGIPNACTRCHADRGTDWEIAATDRWYGDKMESRQRERARVVSGAQRRSPDAGSKLAALITSEDIPAWRATLLQLAGPYLPEEPKLVDLARASLADADANVRSSAVQVLAPLASEHDRLRPLLHDPTRLVRLDAEWALSPELAEASPERKELDAYLAVTADQPTGQLRIGQDLFNRGRAAEAEPHLRRAVAWDPYSAELYHALGVVLDTLDRSADAAGVLWRGAQNLPTDAMLAYQAGLAFAAARKLRDAEMALRESVRREPAFDRGWYNLALLLAKSGRPDDALAALRKAEELAPNVPDYPYARATILLQQGKNAAGAAALRRVLELDPNHPQARALLRGRP